MGLLKWLMNTLGGSRGPDNSRGFSVSEPADPAPSHKNNKKQSVELIVLSEFLKPSSADAIPKNWVSVIGEPSAAFVRRLIKSGKLIQSPLITTIVHCNSGSVLKEWCKERSLKVSGKKLELAQRLIDADEAKMQRLHKGREVLECSPESLERVEIFISEREAERSSVAQRGMLLFHQQKFSEMIQLVADYEACQVRMPGISMIVGLDGVASVRDSEYKPRSRSDDLKSTRATAAAAPKILRGMGDDDLEALKAYCAMQRLMRDHLPLSDLPADFKGVERLGIAGTWRMMHFYLKHRDDIDRMKSIGIKKVEIMTSSPGAGTCVACTKISKVYPMASLPELPYEGCTCEMGCRCWHRAILKGFE